MHLLSLALFVNACGLTFSYVTYSEGPELSSTVGRTCTEREGTSLAVVHDGYIYPWYYTYPIQMLIARATERFPCVTRQYTSIRMERSATFENVFSYPDDYINNLYSWYWNWYYEYELYNCDIPVLSGLKRALEISPPESFVLVITSTSMVDIYNEELLNDIVQLTEEKQSQIFFIWYYGYCGWNDEAFGAAIREIAFRSFGQVVRVDPYNMQSAIFGLDLLLSKPLKSSSFILNLNGSAEARTEFSIESSITYLLITTGGLFHLRLIDPHGNEAEFEIIQTYYTGRAYLVKFPTAGTWTLDLSDCMFESVNIIGYSGVEATGSCVDPVCGINATCEEFGGYHLDCTCELGFAGAGSYCYDIDECSDYNIHHCDYGYCINTLGSYICQCYSGFTYKNKEEGCVDIDECASETHNCHHFASCTNYVGGFSCTCFPGYIGDGHYCEVNECEQGSPCGITEECIKHIGSYTCLDPCHNNTMLEDHWRSTANTYGSQWFSSWGWYHCDNELLGWYRFKGHTDLQMPEYCVPPNSCGTYAPMWLNGPHPTLEEGIVYRTACASYYWYGCCTWSSTLSVKACPDGYYVYKIDRTPMCDSAYCVESNVTCLDINCAPDEYCVTQDGVPECRCIDTTSMRGMDQHSIAAYLSPQVECQISEIRVTFGRCLLERLGYNTSMIRLRDRQCTAFVERANLSYSVSAISVPPRDGYCGGEISGNETEDMIIYRNTIYLIPNYDGIIERDPYPINFYCAFPVDMEVSLLTAVNPFISSAALTVGGTAQLTVRMGLFQTLEYTNLYEGDEVWLDMTSMMYVGVLVEKAKETMQIVLVMKNCFATPTPDKSNPVKYYIIKDSCANRNDPTISVFENGQSLRGRFSLQVFKFIGNFDKVYLHCEVRLCDTAYQNCMPWCGMRSASQDEGSATQTLSIGPLHNRDFKESTSAVPSTSKPPGSNARGISASLEVLVIMLLIAFILLK